MADDEDEDEDEDESPENTVEGLRTFIKNNDNLTLNLIKSIGIKIGLTSLSETAQCKAIIKEA